MNSFLKKYSLIFFAGMIIVACGGNNTTPSKELINELHLKSGKLISCGPPEKEFGIVDFEMTCNEKVKNDFNIAMELLHSFEYEESEKVFAQIIDESPECAMAYWGVAMCNFHPLWEPPSEDDLKKGTKAIEIAKAITGKSEKESRYINAIAAYYKGWEKINPRIRSVNFERAMAQMHREYPD